MHPFDRRKRPRSINHVVEEKAWYMLIVNNQGKKEWIKVMWIPSDKQISQDLIFTERIRPGKQVDLTIYEDEE